MLVLAEGDAANNIIYFHGNAEDLGRTLPFLLMMRQELNAQILAVEYQGYGICEGEATENSVLTDASKVLNYVLNVLKRQPDDVIVMGRSIGTGPACYLASIAKVGALVLISPHTSIQGVVKFMFGSILQYVVKERFTNYEWIKQVA